MSDKVSFTKTGLPIIEFDSSDELNGGGPSGQGKGPDREKL